MSRDDVLFQGTNHLYAYVDSNPLKYIDPFGLSGLGGLAEGAKKGYTIGGDLLKGGKALGEGMQALLKADYDFWRASKNAGLGGQHRFKSCENIDWDKYDQGNFPETFRGLMRNPP